MPLEFRQVRAKNNGIVFVFVLTSTPKLQLKRASKASSNYLEVVGMNLNIPNFLTKYKTKLSVISSPNAPTSWY